MNGEKSALAVLWQVAQVTTIVVCALPGLLFFLVAADPISRNLSDTPAARNVWEVVAIADYFVMIGLSPLLVPIMWFVRWTARASFEPAGKSALTFIAVCGTIGAAFFWIRLFS